MKSDYLKRVISLNKTTKVVIESKKHKTGEIYQNTMSIVHTETDLKPLNFATRKELEHAISELDIEEDQQELFFNEGAQD